MKQDQIAAFPDRFTFELDPELHIGSPVLRLGLQAWIDARGHKELPARRDLDPLRMPRELLPHILLIDLEAGPPERFRWRLVGTHITRVVGRDATGQYWDEIYEEPVLRALSTGPRWAVENRRPVRSLGTAPIDERSFLKSENLDMPLSSDGDTIDMIMVVTDFNQHNA